MVIRNKDGSVYKLRGPSEAMKNQNKWDGFVTHNMKYGSVVQEDTSSVEKMESDFVLKDSFVEELASSIPAEEPAEVSPEPKVVVVRDKSQEQARTSDGIKRTFIYCLPSVLVSVKDSLYDEEFFKVEYGDPFSFEAVIVSEDDMSMTFWSTSVMERESVVFPRTSYKRWWKVGEIREKSGGRIYSCKPSDFHPHFEGV